LLEAIEEYESVSTWFQGLKEQWGNDPEDAAARLEILRCFCQFVGKDPDAVIRECLRTAEGQTNISIKGRRLYDQKIREFQDSVEGDPRRKAHWGNTIRSFLIHNGIFLQSGLQLH